jgi:hypothetical protein
VEAIRALMVAKRSVRSERTQGIAQRVPDGEHGGRFTVADLGRERIHRKPVLGGLINEYSRAA